MAQTTPNMTPIKTTPVTTIDELDMIVSDLATTGRSLARERAVRIERDELLGRPARCRQIPCPCSLSGIWRGVPVARRRHAVLCALWSPPSEAAPR